MLRTLAASSRDDGPKALADVPKRPADKLNHMLSVPDDAWPVLSSAGGRRCAPGTLCCHVLGRFRDARPGLLLNLRTASANASAASRRDVDCPWHDSKQDA
jgi:hypothetical protein